MCQEKKKLKDDNLEWHSAFIQVYKECIKGTIDEMTPTQEMLTRIKEAIYGLKALLTEVKQDKNHKCHQSISKARK